MKILLLHGPNLNLLGEREPDVYGSKKLLEINQEITAFCKINDIEISIIQSNHEGVLIDAIHDARNWASGIVINPGGLTHTSVSLRDAISSIKIPVIEVHLSNVHRREEFRQKSYISAVCLGTITGFGWNSYLLGIRALMGFVEIEN